MVEEAVQKQSPKAVPPRKRKFIASIASKDTLIESLKRTVQKLKEENQKLRRENEILYGKLARKE
jgi:regulator of replication initiation timing